MGNQISRIGLLVLICLLLAFGMTVNAQSTCFDAAGGSIPCPTEPDSDGDGFVDSDDRCPNEAGIPGVGRGDCGDQDGDFITNDGDLCPNESGPAETGGCPLPPTETPIPLPTATSIPPVPTRIPVVEPVTTRCSIIPGFDTDGDCFSVGDLCPSVAGDYFGCPDRESATASVEPREAELLLIALENAEIIPMGEITSTSSDEAQSLLLPAVQTAREQAISSGPICREDEELQMSICSGNWGKEYAPLFGFLSDEPEGGVTEDKTYEDADWICRESEDLRTSICYPQYLNASYPSCDDCDPGHPPVAMEQVVCNLLTSECLMIVVAPPDEECVGDIDSATGACEMAIATTLFELPNRNSDSTTHIIPAQVAFISSPAIPDSMINDIAATDDGDQTAAGTGCWTGRNELGCQVGFGGHFVAVYKQGNMVCYEDSVTGQHCVDL